MDNNINNIREHMIYGDYLKPINEGIFDKFKKKKDNKAEEKEEIKDIEIRKQQYLLCGNIVRSILKKYNNPKGMSFKMGQPYDCKDEFINGNSKEISIFSWDAWKGTNNKARTKEFYDPFLDLVQKLKVKFPKK